MKKTMVRVVQWIKQHLTIIKILFICSVMFFVINQLTSILHGLTWLKFKTLMMNQGWPSIFEMILAGFLAVLPMILYDVGTTRALRVQLPWTELFVNGWIINTINNLAGFGGVVGATLRMNSYSKNKESKSVVATVTKTALFMLTGLSLLSMVMLVVLCFYRQSPYFHYWIWLLGGSCFAPGLFIFIKLNQKRLFREFSNRIIATFYTASFGQWLGAMLIFLFIGHQVVPEMNVLKVAPLFVVATLIGMMTMVPGGMGTFDVLMILGLSAVHVGREVAVVWILFYRLFYFIFPFLSGMALFIHRTGHRLNLSLDGLPQSFVSKVSHLFVTLILYATGIMMILFSAIPNLSNMSRVVHWLVPFSFNFFDQTINMLIGLLLIGLARGFYNKVKRAYGATIVVLSICILNTLMTHLSWRFIVFYLFVMLCVYSARHECYRQKLTYSWNELLFDGAIFSCIFIFYGVIGYFVNTKQAVVTATHFILFPSEEVWFAGLSGLVISALFILALYHYLSDGPILGEVFDDERYTRLIRQYGDGFYKHLAYLKRMRQFYYQVDHHDCVCLSFAIKANRCVVFGNPLGDEAYYLKAIESFISQADQSNYQVVFYGVSEKMSLLLHHLGYEFMKIGEQGVFEETKFHQPAPQSSRLLSSHEITASLAQFEHISEQYEAENRSAYYVSASYNRHFVLSSQVIAHYQAGEMVAYSVLSQPANNQTVSLIYTHCLNDVTAEELKQYMQDVLNIVAQNRWKLSFGMTPLVNVGISKYSFIEERLIRIFYTYGEKMTDLERNYCLLQPYVTNWQDVYLSYPRHQSFFFLLLQLASLFMRGH